MPTYRTKDGDMLDAICHRHYGQTKDVVERVLEANPQLADVGSILPANLLITLPELLQPATLINTVRLWD